MADLSWMAWTWQTGVFFAAIAGVLLLMTALAAWRPEMPRVGLLRFPTTRGDRLFVSLLGAAIIHILWVGFAKDVAGGELWPASLISVAFAAAMFRWA